MQHTERSNLQCKKHDAKSGSVVVLDVQTGEVLAMANQPSFNPNDRSKLRPDSVRNRAMTDMMEPGSTVKPFAILAALESGKFQSNTTIDTHPGYLKVDYKVFEDENNYGLLDLSGIIAKSSNVGTSKIALQLNPNETRELFQRVGFGENLGSGFQVRPAVYCRHIVVGMLLLRQILPLAMA